MRYFNITAALISGALLTCGLTSCNEEDDAISDLSGIFEAPVDLNITGAEIADKTKNGSLRTFTVDFTTSEGDKVHLVLVSNQYYLTTNGYSYASAENAKNGNFTDGSTINGSSVNEGTFSLSKSDDNYAITTCTLFTVDGKAYRLSGEATLLFEPDDPTALTTLKSATDNGDGTLTVLLSTGGWSGDFDWTTYQMVYTGEGNDLQIVFNSTDGKLHEGTYSAGSGYVAGYTGSVDYGWGPMDVDAGTLWYSVADGAQVISHVTSGDIVVSKNGPLYTILIDQGKGGIYAEFTGSIPDLDPDGDSGNVTLLGSVVGVTNWASFGWGIQFIDIQLATGDVASSYDYTTSTTSYSGNGTLVQIEVYSADGTLARGDYDIADDSTFGVGKFHVGCDNAYSPGSPSGSYTCLVTDGVLGEASFISEGTLNISGEDDATSITLTVGDVTYMFTGNIGL